MNKSYTPDIKINKYNIILYNSVNVLATKIKELYKDLPLKYSKRYILSMNSGKEILGFINILLKDYCIKNLHIKVIV